MGNRINRREALGIMAASGACVWNSPAIAQSQAKRKQPNIIFILADDLGYGDVGCYGQTRIRTPRLNEMASQGMRFTQAYAGSTVCAPSRSVLMTGLHTGHTKIRGNSSGGKRIPLAPEDRTVAEILKEAGYATGLIGKWGLGDPGTTGIPNRKGFDEFFGYLDQGLAHNYYPDKLWRNEKEIPIEGNVLAEYNVCDEGSIYSHDLFTREALSFIDQHKDGPFFLYLAYTLPHANNERGRARAHGMEIPSDEPYSNEPWPEPQRCHAAMISLLDRDVGRVLDKLKENSIAEDTLVIFTSDNGPHAEGGADSEFFNSNGPFRGIKRDLYEGGIRVPAIAWQPGSITPGSVSDHIWAFWDFLPTAAELAGITAPACDGISIVPTLKGAVADQRKHNHLYWEFHEKAFKQAVRMGNWKAIRNGQDQITELYDLEKDPGEIQNIAETHQDIIMITERLFIESRKDSPYWPEPNSMK